MIFQTQVNKPSDVLRGSGMLEIALYGGDEWFQVGAISDLKVEENFDLYTAEEDDIYESDNVVNQNMKVSFTQHEVLNSGFWDVLRGIDTMTEYLSGTTEYIKVESGDLTELNEIKCRITTKHNGLNYYTYLHRGNVVKGKGFSHPSDSADDSRVKQAVEIIFRPDSANSDQIYYTLQPAIYNEKFHKCQGDIYTGITLFIGPSENMPLSDWTLYDSETYDDSYYAPAAFYQSELLYKDSRHSLMTWTATGDANDVKISVRQGNTIETLSAWSTPANAIGSGQTKALTSKFVQYRFIFYSSTWADTDSVTLSSIV